MNTKMKINWKLKDLPTGSEVAQLVDAGVLTVDEARAIIISSEEDIRVQQSQAEVQHLKTIVKEMFDGRSSIYIPWATAPWLEGRSGEYYTVEILPDEPDTLLLKKI